MSFPVNHLLLKSSLSNHKGRNLKIRIRNFSNNYLQTTSSLSFCWANYEVMNKLLSDKPFNGVCWSNVEELLERWYNWLKDILARTVPKRTANRSSLSPWVKPARSNIIKKLETAKLSKKSTISKSENFERYVKQCRKTSLTMEQSFCPRNTGTLFKTIEHLQPLKSQPQFISKTNLQLTNFHKRNFFGILHINFH